MVHPLVPAPVARLLPPVPPDRLLDLLAQPLPLLNIHRNLHEGLLGFFSALTLGLRNKKSKKWNVDTDFYTTN